ncbi:MAG: ABC transporter substrate-binding protein [Desulfobacteraceae bacterium]|nr:ABC transporter substrate-binding protein [Desulfobacteraceae bacterium]
MAKRSVVSLVIVGLLLTLVLGGAFYSQPSMAAEKVVKIGLSAPLTGDWAEYGNDFKRSVQMVFARVNRMGGVRGKMIELVIADSRGDPKEAVLIAEKFVADPDIIAEIGDFSSSCCMAAASIYDRTKMTQLSPTSSHMDFTKKGENMFRVVATQGYEGPYNARWAVKDLGKKRLATIYINNDWGVDANKYFTQEARKLGAEVVAEEAFIPGEKDFAAILSKLKRLNLDLIYLPTFYADAAAILNQAKRMHFKPVVMANSSLFSEKTIELGGAAVEGIIIPANYFSTDPRPAAQEFTREYKALYGSAPNQFAALAYDAANLMIAALHKVGVDERSKVRGGLLSLRGFKGATGSISYAAGRDPAKELVRITIKDGRWVLYNP